MANLMYCVFCNNSDDIISFFTKDTLAKCQQILKLRKEHNLKYKNVVLPLELFESGFHRQCYKAFTGLMKKYYSSNSKPIPPLTPKQELSSAPTNLCSVFIRSQAIEAQQFSSRSSSPAITVRADPITIPLLKIEPDIITGNLVPSSLQENSVNSETLNFIYEDSIPIVSDESIVSKSIICIFCDRKIKKHHSKFLPLHSTSKKKFISKFTQESEKNLDLINKIENFPDSIVYYHAICQFNLNNKNKLSKETKKSAWHDRRQCHQIAFNEMSAFIQENVVKKEQFYFLNYLHRYYIAVLDTNEDNVENVTVNFTTKNLEDKIVKHFKKEVKLISYQGKRLLAPKSLTTIDDQSFENLKQKDILQKAALLLRKSILQEKLKK